MPKHTSLSCKQMAANDEAFHAAQKSQVEIKRAKKKAKKVEAEAHECECDHEGEK